MKKGVLFLLLTFLSIFHLVGQELSFKRFSASDGLSNNWVRCFYQDNFGFIWIGTSDGLNRFDGRNFKVFRPVTENNFAMGNVTVNNIIAKNDTILWIATDGGLFTFNMVTEEMNMDMLLSAHPVLSVIKDHTNTFWFGTNHGLVEYNPINETKTFFSTQDNDAQKIPNDYINLIATDSNNNLWVGTKNGLLLYNRAAHEFKTYRHGSQNGSISGNDITDIVEDNWGRIWIGTALNGLNLLVNTSSGFKFKQIMSGAITDLYIEGQNRLWVGHSSNEGIKIIDLEAFSNNRLNVQTIKSNPFEKNTISENSTFCFLRRW